MSLQETKIADNVIYDSLFDTHVQDSNSTPFLKKNVAYVVDQQAGNGSYTSGEVIIDTQSIAASGNTIDWRGTYIAAPIQTKWDAQFATAPGAVTANGAATKFALAMKNCSLLDSLKVEANGKVILTATTGLSNLVNFKLLSTMTPASIAKDGSLIGFYPDSEGICADGGKDSINNSNDISNTSLFGDKTRQVNTGLVERQDGWLPSMNTQFLDAAGAKNECSAWDYASGSVLSVTTTQTLSDVHWVAIIRLKDIADYFDKHPLSRGVAYRFTLKFNQAVTTLLQSSSTSFSASDLQIVSNSQTSGSVQPAMLCVGPSTLTGKLAWTNASVVNHTVSTLIDTTSNSRISGIRMYVPSYEMEPSHQEKLLSSNPIIKRSFMDFMTQSTSTFAAPGGRINVQVSTSATNPRALIIVPRWSQVASGSGGQGFFSEASPLSTVPGTTDAFLSLINVQVKMGSTYVLPDRLFYTFQEYLDNLSSIFAINGNQSVNTGGLISKKSFEVNNRYYAFDLSRYPEAMTNLPQMISLECDNNSAVPIELTCYLLYGRDAEFNLAQGSLTITA